MWVSRKRFKALEQRMEKLEENASHPQLVSTAEHGSKTVAWYIRFFSANIKDDPSKKLRSWGD